jgi:hypothetical protein
MRLAGITTAAIVAAAALTALTVTGGSLPSASQAHAGEFGPVKTHQLPDDPKAILISLDHQSGFTGPRTGQGPTMTISADGTVTIPANYQGQKAFQEKLTRQEVQELLRFVIDKNEFFNFDPQAVQKKKKLASGGLQMGIMDAATTVIVVHADGKSKEVRQYALGLGHGPAVKELQQLVAVKNRLEQVRSTVQLGGEEEVGKWLKLVNKQLKAKYPQVKPLTVEDLQSGAERADGSVYVSFNRPIPSPDGNPRSAGGTNASVRKPAAGNMRVTVSHRPAK